MRIKVTYYVADGYLTGDRPLFMDIETSDYEGMPTEEIRTTLDDEVWDHMLQNCATTIDDIDDLVAKIAEAKETDNND